MTDYKHLKNILFLDIETVSCVGEYNLLPEILKPLWDKKCIFLRKDREISNEELFFERSGIYAEFGKIVTIAVGFFNKNEAGELCLRVKSIASDDEATILQEFKALLEKFNQKKLVLCAHNGKEFDFPYISRRMLIHCLPLPAILDYAGKKPWEVPHLDTLEMWKFGDRKNYTSLDLLAAIFDIKSSKNDIDGSQVNQVYYIEKDLNRIAEYCKLDVVVTAQLFLKFKCLPVVKEENILLL